MARGKKQENVAAAVKAAAPTGDERERLIQDLIAKSAAQFGKIGTLSGSMSSSQEDPVGVISTGSIGVDRALGVGGIPRGRIVEVFGGEAGGKTTLALHLIAEVQRAGGIAAFIDAEHALDIEYAQSLGVNTDLLVFAQPDCGEDALNLADTFVGSGNVDLIVIDSVAALVPRHELEGKIGDSHVGLQARMMGQALRILTGKICRTNTVVLFINQLREKVGVMFGSPKTTTGGNALKFYASVRIEVTKIGSLTRNEKQFGNRVRINVLKNKVAAPFRSAEVDLIFGEGISWAGELIDFATAQNIVQKSGSWYSYGERRLGQGREAVMELLKNDPAFASEIRGKISL